MKYAREIVELMGAYPGRAFKMHEIVRAVAGRKASLEESFRVRKGVCRVLQQLEAVGTICVIEQRGRGAAARYIWKNQK